MHGKDRSAVIGFIVFVCVAIAVWIAMINWLSSDNRDTTDGNETIESSETAPLEHYEPELYEIESDRSSDVKIFCDGPDRVYFNNDQIRIVRDSVNCPDQRSVGEVVDD